MAHESIEVTVEALRARMSLAERRISTELQEILALAPLHNVSLTVKVVQHSDPSEAGRVPHVAVVGVSIGATIWA